METPNTSKPQSSLEVVQGQEALETETEKAKLEKKIEALQNSLVELDKKILKNPSNEALYEIEAQEISNEIKELEEELSNVDSSEQVEAAEPKIVVPAEVEVPKGEASESSQNKNEKMSGFVMNAQESKVFMGEVSEKLNIFSDRVKDSSNFKMASKYLEEIKGKRDFKLFKIVDGTNIKDLSNEKLLEDIKSLESNKKGKMGLTDPQWHKLNQSILVLASRGVTEGVFVNSTQDELDADNFAQVKEKLRNGVNANVESVNAQLDQKIDNLENKEDIEQEITKFEQYDEELSTLQFNFDKSMLDADQSEFSTEKKITILEQFKADIKNIKDDVDGLFYSESRAENDLLTKPYDELSKKLLLQLKHIDEKSEELSGYSANSSPAINEAEDISNKGENFDNDEGYIEEDDNQSIDEPSLETEEKKEPKISALKKYAMRGMEYVEKAKGTTAGKLFTKFNNWTNKNKWRRVSKKMIISATVGATVGAGAGVALAALAAGTLAGGAADLLHKKFSKGIVEKRIQRDQSEIIKSSDLDLNSIEDFADRVTNLQDINSNIDKIEEEGDRYLTNEEVDTYNNNLIEIKSLSLYKQRLDEARVKHERRNRFWGMGIRIIASASAGMAFRFSGAAAELVNSPGFGESDVSSVVSGNGAENTYPAKEITLTNTSVIEDGADITVNKGLLTVDSVNQDTTLINQVSDVEDVISEATAKIPKALEIGYVGDGDGITHIILRQLEANPDLADSLDVSADASGAFEAAEKLGYISENGEIRLDLEKSKGISYLLEADANGDIVMNEYGADGMSREIHSAVSVLETETESNENFVSKSEAKNLARQRAAVNSTMNSGGTQVTQAQASQLVQDKTDSLAGSSDPITYQGKSTLTDLDMSNDNNVTFEGKKTDTDLDMSGSKISKEKLLSAFSEVKPPDVVAADTGIDTLENAGSDTNLDSDQNPRWKEAQAKYGVGINPDTNSADYSAYKGFRGNESNGIFEETRDMLQKGDYLQRLKSGKIPGFQQGAWSQGVEQLGPIGHMDTYILPNGQYVVEFDGVSKHGSRDAMEIAQAKFRGLSKITGVKFNEAVIDSATDVAANYHTKVFSTVSRDQFYYLQNLARDTRGAVAAR